MNFFFQIQFFIIVSSSSAYAEALGGTNTFSGLVIGIPTAFSGLALIPLSRYDNGTPLIHPNASCSCSPVRKQINTSFRFTLPAVP